MMRSYIYIRWDHLCVIKTWDGLERQMKQKNLYKPNYTTGPCLLLASPYCRAVPSVRSWGWDMRLQDSIWMNTAWTIFHCLPKDFFVCLFFFQYTSLHFLISCVFFFSLQHIQAFYLLYALQLSQYILCQDENKYTWVRILAACQKVISRHDSVWSKMHSGII